jgi:hypothetical protein
VTTALSEAGIGVGVVVHVAVGNYCIGYVPRAVVSSGKDTGESSPADVQIVQREGHVGRVGGKGSVVKPVVITSLLAIV